MNKTVLELDLVGYSDVAATLEENIGAGAVAHLNRQIQDFIDRGLLAVNAARDETIMATTGDGAILMFDEAERAHHFALAVHEATREHNRERKEPSAVRLFRMGAATGDISISPRAGGGYDIAGLTISRAVRLESAAAPGELVIDAATYDRLPARLRSLYGGETSAPGKRAEEFPSRRLVMNPDAAQTSAPSRRPGHEKRAEQPGRERHEKVGGDKHHIENSRIGRYSVVKGDGNIIADSVNLSEGAPGETRAGRRSGEKPTE